MNIRRRLTNLESSTTDEPVIIAPLSDGERTAAINALFKAALAHPDDVALGRRAQAVRQILGGAK